MRQQQASGPADSAVATCTTGDHGPPQLAQLPSNRLDLVLQAHGALRRHGYAWRFVRIGTLSGAATDTAGACYARRAGKSWLQP